MKNSINVFKFLSLALLMVTITQEVVQAQRGWELGGDIGISHYYGELNNQLDFTHPGAAVGVVGRYNFNTRLCIQMGARYVYLRGRDVWSDNNFQLARNLSFRSHTGEIFLNMEFNYMEYIHGAPYAGFTPYVLAGLNYIRMQPQAARLEDGRKVWYNLRPLGTEGQLLGEEYRLFHVGIMFGVGMKIDLSRYWSLNIQLAGRYLYTDYLDDVSTTYPDKERLLDRRGELGAYFSDRSIPTEEYPFIGEAGRQRGVSGSNDMYSTLTVGVMYYFYRLRCPEISRWN